MNLLKVLAIATLAFFVAFTPIVMAKDLSYTECPKPTPTFNPTPEPTATPTEIPTPDPTFSPTPIPTPKPTLRPSVRPHPHLTMPPTTTEG